MSERRQPPIDIIIEPQAIKDPSACPVPLRNWNRFRPSLTDCSNFCVVAARDPSSAAGTTETGTKPRSTAFIAKAISSHSKELNEISLHTIMRASISTNTVRCSFLVALCLGLLSSGSAFVLSPPSCKAARQPQRSIAPRGGILPPLPVSSAEPTALAQVATADDDTADATQEAVVATTEGDDAATSKASIQRERHTLFVGNLDFGECQRSSPFVPGDFLGIAGPATNCLPTPLTLNRWSSHPPRFVVTLARSTPPSDLIRPLAGTTDEDLRELFQQYGTVELVNLPRDRNSGRPRGFAFVDMATNEAADAASAALDGMELRSREIRVAKSVPKEDLPPRQPRNQGAARAGSPPISETPAGAKKIYVGNIPFGTYESTP